MTFDWSYFDAIVCINLDTRTDRKLIVEEFFKTYNIKAKFYIAKRHADGAVGSFESHRNVIKEAYDSGAQKILVFEDDPQATETLTPANLKICIDFMRTHKWDLFNFGATPDLVHYTANKTEVSNIFNVHAYYSHCYAISRDYMEKISKLEYVDILIDTMFKYNKLTYTYLPIMVSQSSLGSDVVDPTFLSDSDFIEFTRNLFFYYYIVYINKTIGTVAFYLIMSILSVVFFFNPSHFISFVFTIISVITFVYYKYQNSLRNIKSCLASSPISESHID